MQEYRVDTVKCDQFNGIIFQVSASTVIDNTKNKELYHNLVEMWMYVIVTSNCYIIMVYKLDPGTSSSSSSGGGGDDDDDDGVVVAVLVIVVVVIINQSINQSINQKNLYSAMRRKQIRGGRHFCRAMLCIARLLPSPGFCLSVCPSVTFVSCAKTNKGIFEIFHHVVT